MREWSFLPWAVLACALLQCGRGHCDDFSIARTELVAVEHVHVVETRRDVGQRGNWVVYAGTMEESRRLGEVAEQLRHDLAVGWFGEPIDDWGYRVQLRFSRGNGGGRTVSNVSGGSAIPVEVEVTGRTIDEAIQDVLPHEIMHTITHTKFGMPALWLNEGLSTNSESLRSIQARDKRLRERLSQGRAYKLRTLFSLAGYTPDPDVYYPESCSITRYLLVKGGIEKLSEVAVRPSMSPDEIARHYGYDRVESLESEWVHWVRDGSPITTEMLQCGPSGCSPMMGRMLGPSSRIPGDFAGNPPQQGGVPTTSTPPKATPKAPIGSTAKHECDMDAIRDTIRDELASIELPAGPRGEPGPPGQDGRDAEISGEQLSAIADHVLDAMRTDETFRGQDGKDAELTADDIDAIVAAVGEAVASDERLAERLAGLVVSKLPPIKVNSYDRENNLLQQREYAYPGPIRLRFGVLPE